MQSHKIAHDLRITSNLKNYWDLESISPADYYYTYFHNGQSIEYFSYNSIFRKKLTALLRLIQWIRFESIDHSVQV